MILFSCIGKLGLYRGKLYSSHMLTGHVELLRITEQTPYHGNATFGGSKLSFITAPPHTMESLIMQLLCKFFLHCQLESSWMGVQLRPTRNMAQRISFQPVFNPHQSALAEYFRTLLKRPFLELLEAEECRCMWWLIHGKNLALQRNTASTSACGLKGKETMHQSVRLVSPVWGWTIIDWYFFFPFDLSWRRSDKKPIRNYNRKGENMPAERLRSSLNNLLPLAM